MSYPFAMAPRVDGELGYSTERARAQLTTIRNLLADPARRAVRANARDAGGKRTEWYSSAAAAWGVYGAVWLVTNDDSALSRRNTDRHWLAVALVEQIPPDGNRALSTYTDGLPHGQLLEFLDRAIAAA